MTKTQMVSALGVCVLLSVPAAAQTVPAAAAAAPARDPGQFVNVRIDLTIHDQSGTGTPARKTVSLFVADRSNASMRTSGRLYTKEGWRDVTINVDARPTLIRSREGAVQVDLGLEYRPIAPGQAATPQAGTPSPIELTAQPTGFNQRIAAILESGKPIVIAQAADPSSDRRISVELKATIEK
jgi:hypothetical protein